MPSTSCSCASIKTSICRRDGIEASCNSSARRSVGLARSAWLAWRIRCWAGVVGSRPTVGLLRVRGRKGRRSLRGLHPSSLILHPSSPIPHPCRGRRADRLGRRSRADAQRRSGPAGQGRHARRAAAGRAAGFAAAVRPGARVSPVWSGYLPPGGGTRVGGRGDRCIVPSQFAEHRAAGGVLPERRGFRPQMEPPAAGRHAVRHHRQRRDGALAGECDHIRARSMAYTLPG